LDLQVLSLPRTDKIFIAPGFNPGNKDYNMKRTP